MLSLLNEYHVFESFTTLILALALGGLIGLEREKRTRSAGFRTYSLVCLGAALVMLIGNYAFVNIGGSNDITRLGAQVVSGIGFLGAGAIISSQQKVIGLTTAAALWTCACIGLAVGIGYYSGAIIACLITVVLLRFLQIVDRKSRDKEHFADLYLELVNANEISLIINFLQKSDIPLVSLVSVSPKVSRSEIGIELTIKVKTDLTSNEILNAISNICNISVAHKKYI